METATTPMQSKPLVDVTCKLGTKGCFKNGRCHYMGNCENKIETNADRIRAMSDRELAHFMAARSVNESTLLLINEDHGLTAVQIEEIRHRIYCACLQWLREPADRDILRQFCGR